MTDDTEASRRLRQAALNAAPAALPALEARYGQVWDTAELRETFEVLGFAAPFVVVRRKADGCQGSLLFQHHPRFYFCWQADDEEG